MKITYNGPLQAPIAKGAQIARLEVKMGQDAPIVLPLVAGADVPAGLGRAVHAGFPQVLRMSAGRFIALEGGEGVGKSPVAASCDGFARGRP
jgi:hypothetical protein